MAKKTEIIKTKYGSFSCVFEPEKDMGGYMVVAKGIQGAISWGKNMTEARRMIIESIEGAVEVNILIEAELRGDIKLAKKLIPSNIA